MAMFKKLMYQNMFNNVSYSNASIYKVITHSSSNVESLNLSFKIALNPHPRISCLKQID